ncbi:Glu-tRNA(Gln) amidotransferase subunit GatE, partial [Candidatus Micrarchaeota archaeon]|nr:Glu-tRNA(Gln) amidotransferase subunit GatE [Candidatus Micrarchaeota archaeon]
MKIGLELHQRLDTSKLFCECPYLLIEGEEPEVKITRRLHPVLSELGEVDEASKQEFAKGKAYEYYAYGKANCMVEIDEEPPHKINTEALATVLQIANQLHSKPVDEVHVMRKIIIDGSITSGFQRTAVVSLGGYLETSRGKVRITQLSLEEESAGIVETGKEKSIFELDRMGIPLIEITTEPDIKDAEHLSEVAEKIGLLMRATGKVARGLGTIRQDLNISVEGGARVEIKGAQDLKLLPTLLKEEVRRQENLIKLDNEIKRRDAEAHAGVKPLT